MTTNLDLDAQVARAVRDGWGIESRTDTQVVLVRRPRIRHVLHLALTVVTGGVWGIVWAVLVLRNKPQRQVLAPR